MYFFDHYQENWSIAVFCMPQSENLIQGLISKRLHAWPPHATFLLTSQNGQEKAQVNVAEDCSDGIMSVLKHLREGNDLWWDDYLPSDLKLNQILKEIDMCEKTSQSDHSGELQR
jgi:hypothetical protein